MNKTIKFAYVMAIILLCLTLTGCKNLEKDTQNNAKTNEKITTTDNNKEKTVKVEEVKPDAPAEIAKLGYEYFYERKENTDKTYAYEIFTDKPGACSSGYLNDNVPIKCLLKIVDLKNNKTIIELQSDENAVFNLNETIFVAPSEWYVNNSLLIVSGFGDGGISKTKARSLDVVTKKFTTIYEESTDSAGTLFIIDENRLWFHTPLNFNSGVNNDANELQVYKIKEPIIDIWDLYIKDSQTELDFSKGEKLNSLEGSYWPDYELDKGIIIKDANSDSKYIYDIQNNKFIPYK